MYASDILYYLVRQQAVLGANTMAAYHFSNFAVDKVLPRDQGLILGESYEDRNLWEMEEAERVANLLEDLMPGKYVRIRTGDYIVSENPEYSYRHPNCETYDPNYYHWLFPVAVFEAHRAELERVDRQWRDEKQKIANGDITDEVIGQPAGGE